MTEPIPDGTLLTSRLRLEARGTAALFEPILGRLLARDSRRDEIRLKRLLEHEAA